MGYQNENASRICFDVETAPLPEAADYLEPAKAPANYKDPAKIAAAIEEKNAENLAGASLDVDLCRVVAIGHWIEGEEFVHTRSYASDNETTMLREFWHEAESRHLVGFNCLDFDLPVLLRRSLYLGVRVPRAIQIDRYKHPQVTDLMQELSFNGKLKFRGLSFYTKRFGINVPDAVNGSDIAQLVTDGNWTAIEAHVKADVTKTAHLANKLGHFNLQPTVTGVF